MNSEGSRNIIWFAQEVQPHESALRSWLAHRFPSLSDVDDVVQESYIRLIRAKEKGQVNRTKAFLFSIARNFVLDLFRRERVLCVESIADFDGLCVLEEGPGVAESVSHQQELAMLADAVRTLPDRCRAILTLRLLHELSPHEIAAELGLSVNTVRVQLAKGMRRCAEYFEQHGDVP